MGCGGLWVFRSFLPIWHPDGVRRVMGFCVLCYRCGTPMGCGGLWGFSFVFTDVAPLWGAEGLGCLCFVLPIWHPDGVRRVMGVCVLCYRCGTPMGCDQLLSLNFYLLSFIFYLLSLISYLLSLISYPQIFPHLHLFRLSDHHRLAFGHQP